MQVALGKNNDMLYLADQTEGNKRFLTEYMIERKPTQSL